MTLYAGVHIDPLPSGCLGRPRVPYLITKEQGEELRQKWDALSCQPLGVLEVTFDSFQRARDGADRKRDDFMDTVLGLESGTIEVEE
tara:strand:+ start:697 stop:957 length:261 start_codon:yes stop_codon:yes gene_type:complete